MNILIVDDEFYIVQGLKSLLEKNFPEDIRILEAYSAEQARKVYAANQVDILVTDIGMPRESGLDLITWVRDSGYSSLNILLSGHEDFAFAKAAIELQCFRYCLKPVDSEDLLSAIESAMKTAASNNADASRERRFNLITFWRGLLNGATLPTEESIRQSARNLGLPESFLSDPHGSSFLFFLLTIQPKKPGYLDVTEQVPYHVLEETARAVYPVPDPTFTSVDRSTYMLCMRSWEEAQASPAKEGEFYRPASEDLIRELSEAFPAFRFVLYTMPPTSLISAFYAHELLSRYASSVLTSQSCVLSIMDESLAGPDDAFGDQDTLRKWRGWFEAGRTGDILRELRMNLYRENAVFSSKKLSYLYYSLLNMVFSVLSEAAIEASDTITGITGHADLVTATSSIESFLSWAERLLSNGQSVAEKNRSSNSTAETVKKYIRDNIANPDLSRNMIAEAAHISPDYLSYLFKKETGDVLSSFINSERIQIAKKLLRTTDLPLHAIAAESGFSNETYFHKQFKRLTNMTPNAYRTNTRGK